MRKNKRKENKVKFTQRRAHCLTKYRHSFSRFLTHKHTQEKEEESQGVIVLLLLPTATGFRFSYQKYATAQQQKV